LKILWTVLAATLGLAAPAAAHPGEGGTNYYFYGPSTNYFGSPGYAAGRYTGGGYGMAGYPAHAPAPAYYGGYYGWDDDDNPPAAYEGLRHDPWRGYDPYWDE
jgi:hypothetical protein